ncbi:hypothetical protein CYMTET_22244 [Cymbomonas tetramitiformis]|uniref:Uncharacterized protein n=1 Tax=Cymbomonas tetramitiformis TaxID=36881 RepID=A0AAE0G0F3_9CHLO|nr:hypothetical protein CYMTET_22244 [Cymbomonas tetramitiformis]
MLQTADHCYVVPMELTTSQCETRPAAASDSINTGARGSGTTQPPSVLNAQSLARPHGLQPNSNPRQQRGAEARDHGQRNASPAAARHRVVPLGLAALVLRDARPAVVPCSNRTREPATVQRSSGTPEPAASLQCDEQLTTIHHNAIPLEFAALALCDVQPTAVQDSSEAQLTVAQGSNSGAYGRGAMQPPVVCDVRLLARPHSLVRQRDAGACDHRQHHALPAAAYHNVESLSLQPSSSAQQRDVEAGGHEQRNAPTGSKR